MGKKRALMGALAGAVMCWVWGCGDAGPPPTPGTVIGTQNDGGGTITYRSEDGAGDALRMRGRSQSQCKERRKAE